MNGASNGEETSRDEELVTKSTTETIASLCEGERTISATSGTTWRNERGDGRECRTNSHATAARASIRGD